MAQVETQIPQWLSPYHCPQQNTVEEGGNPGRGVAHSGKIHKGHHMNSYC